MAESEPRTGVDDPEGPSPAEAARHALRRLAGPLGRLRGAWRRRSGSDEGADAAEAAETVFDGLDETGVVDIGGVPWMAGVFWGPELVKPGEGARLCRERTRAAREAAKSGEEVPGVDDVAVVYEVEKGREAWGVGSSSRGHAGGMGVLAAQVQKYFYGAESEAEESRHALEWSARRGMICGFDIPGGGFYVVAVQNGTILGDTDIVKESREEARQIFMRQQVLARSAERGWLMVAPESWDVPSVHSQVSIVQLVAEGPAVTARSPKEMLRRLGKLALVAGGAAAVVWAVLQVAGDLGSRTSALEQQLAQQRRELQAQLRDLVPVEEYGEIFSVPAAPWETGQVPEGRHAMGVCVSLVRSVSLVVPVEQVGRTVSRVICTLSAEGRASLAVETRSVVPTQDPRPLLFGEGTFEGVALRGLVPLEVTAAAEGAAWYGGVDLVLAQAPGAVLIREDVAVAEQAQTGAEAWARAGFSVLLADAPERLPTLRNVLVRPEVALTQVSFLVAEAQWEVRGWVAAAKPLLREVRALEGRAAEARAHNEQIKRQRVALQEELANLPRR